MEFFEVRSQHQSELIFNKEIPSIQDLNQAFSLKYFEFLCLFLFLNDYLFLNDNLNFKSPQFVFE